MILGRAAPSCELNTKRRQWGLRTAGHVYMWEQLPAPAQDGTVLEYTSFHGPLAVSPVCILKSSGPYGSLALPYLDGMMPAMRSGLGARRNATAKAVDDPLIEMILWPIIREPECRRELTIQRFGCPVVTRG